MIKWIHKDKRFSNSSRSLLLVLALKPHNMNFQFYLKNLLFEKSDESSNDFYMESLFTTLLRLHQIQLAVPFKNEVKM